MRSCAGGAPDDRRRRGLAQIDLARSSRKHAGERRARRTARSISAARLRARRRRRRIVLEGVGTWDPPTTAARRERPGRPLRHLRLRRADGGGGGGHRARHHQGRARSSPRTTSAAPSTRRWWRARSTAASRQGLGLALMEEFIPGRTENLHDYLIPTVGDMPRDQDLSDRGRRAGWSLRRQGRRRAGADRHRAGHPLRHPPRHRRAHHPRPRPAAPALGGAAEASARALLALERKDARQQPGERARRVAAANCQRSASCGGPRHRAPCRGRR